MIVILTPHDTKLLILLDTQVRHCPVPLLENVQRNVARGQEDEIEREEWDFVWHVVAV